MPREEEDQRFSFNASVQAAAYAKWVAPMFVPWINYLVDMCPPSPGDELLDVATGTGDLAYALAARVGGKGRVLGTDFSPSMLDNARGKSRSAALSAISNCIEWQEGDASSMLLPESRFSAAFCHQGLQFVPDPEAACRNVVAALREGGSFVAGVWAPLESNPVFFTVEKALSAAGKAHWARLVRKPSAWADTEEEGVARMKQCLEAAGFVDVDVFVKEIFASFENVEAVYMLCTSSPFGSELAADQEVFESYKAHVISELLPFTDSTTGKVAMPMRSILAHAKAPAHK